MKQTILKHDTPTAGWYMVVTKNGRAVTGETPVQGAEAALDLARAHLGLPAEDAEPAAEIPNEAQPDPSRS